MEDEVLRPKAWLKGWPMKRGIQCTLVVIGSIAAIDVTWLPDEPTILVCGNRIDQVTTKQQGRKDIRWTPLPNDDYETRELILMSVSWHHLGQLGASGVMQKARAVSSDPHPFRQVMISNSDLDSGISGEYLLAGQAAKDWRPC
ncbi:MAG: hypothetical protein KAH44_31755 [Oricola sp.]|nr:hypothetical protein [Oricola sp.]